MNDISLLNTKTLNDEKFKATKLWNDIVYAFYIGIPIRKHRRRMKSYSSCFVAREATQWLHNYLQMNPYFGHEISRFHALSLLEKFVKTEIIEKIYGKRMKRHEFKDNKDLYRFNRNTIENMTIFKDIHLNNHVPKASETLAFDNKVQTVFNCIEKQIMSEPLCSNHHHISNDIRLPQNCTFETTFLNDNPITRIVPMEGFELFKLSYNN